MKVDKLNAMRVPDNFMKPRNSMVALWSIYPSIKTKTLEGIFLIFLRRGLSPEGLELERRRSGQSQTLSNVIRLGFVMDKI